MDPGHRDHTVLRYEEVALTSTVLAGSFPHPTGWKEQPNSPPRLGVINSLLGDLVVMATR